MSSAFSDSLPKGQPAWSKLSVLAGTFTKVNVLASPTVLEVGYGQGGYGQDGYDTPAQIIAGVTLPNWTVYPATTVYPAIGLRDANGVSWSVTVDTTGHLVTMASVAPAGSLLSSSMSDLLIVLSDINGNLWNVFVDVTGHLTTAPIRQGLAFFSFIDLRDATGRVWVLTVLSSGNLVTT